MGLLNDNNNNKDIVYTGDKISDCVGRVGFCEAVTDPRNNTLYKNTTLWETPEEMEAFFRETFDKTAYDKNAITNVRLSPGQEPSETANIPKSEPYVERPKASPVEIIKTEEVVKAEDTSVKEENIELNDDIIAQALLSIIKNLEEIAHLLKERK